MPQYYLFFILASFSITFPGTWFLLILSQQSKKILLTKGALHSDCSRCVMDETAQPITFYENNTCNYCGFSTIFGAKWS